MDDSKGVLIGLALAASVVAAAAQQPPPQFRAGVAVTRLEVTVLDKRTRAPVIGLTAKDFVIEVNGRVQPIVSLAEVRVPSAKSDAAPGIVEAARDVTSNELSSPRLFVLIMNDALGGRDPFHRATGKAIANRFVDLLGPEDLVSVIFVRDNRPAQDVTQDRVLIRRAVEEYRPMSLDWRMAQPMATLALLRTLEFLRPMSGYRRAVVFITPAVGNEEEEVDTANLKDFADRADPFEEIGFTAMSAATKFSHIPVYTFSAQGLQAPTGRDIASLRPGEPGSPLRQFDAHVETLRTIADLTGGRATVGTNTPADRVPAMFNELSSYYALAYEQTDPADGRLRRLDVQVTRADSLVVSSRLVLAPSGTATKPQRGTDVSRTGLFAALESPVPLGTLPLRLAALPVAVSGAREQAVALTLGLPPVAAAEQFRVRLLVYDGQGLRQIVDTARVVDIARGTDADGTELAMRVLLRPGRYNVRIAAERGSDGTAGTVHATVEVPDFANESLSLSGVAIGRAGGRPVAGRADVEGLLPFAPTAARTFAQIDRVGALLRVHQKANRVVPVTLGVSITDAMGGVLKTQSEVIESAAFEGGAADYRFEIPLADLAPGVYLLRFVARAGAISAQRDVRFSMR